jgi:transposase
MRELACRHQNLTAEIGRLETALAPLIARTAPRLLAVFGAGPNVAGALFTTAGDNPVRLGNERSFAPLVPPHRWRHPQCTPPGIA